MSLNKKKQETDANEEIIHSAEHAVFSIEHFWEKHQKNILIALGVIAALVLLMFAYFKWYKPKQEVSAQAAIFNSQEYFKMDSFNLALNGKDGEDGFLSVISDHGGTKAANLAKYYAGICYLNTGKFEDAIDMLKSYSADDILTGAMAYGAMGDAYMELNKTDDGISAYRKAAQASDNELTAPMFWLRYAQACENFNKLEDAKEGYNTVAKKYPNTPYGRDAEKYLARINVKIQQK